MFKKRPLTVLFLCLLGLSTLAVTAANRIESSQSIKPQTLQPARPQSAALRVETLDALPADWTLARPAPELTGPIRIEADEDGHLFVVDEGRGELISEYLGNGTFVKALHTGGAPAIASVADLAVLPQTVIVADLLGKAIHYYDRSQGTWLTRKDPKEPLRIEPVGRRDDNLMIMRIGGRWPFDLASHEGVVSRSFGDLVENQKEQSLILDGYIARAGGAVIYSGKFLGLLASYSDTGALNWTVETIVAPEPASIVQAGERRFVSHGPILASQGLAATVDAAGVLARRIDGIAIRYFIDIYRATDGSYVKSLRLPAERNWTSVTIGGGSVFASGSKGIYRWPAEVLNADTPERSLEAGEVIVSLAARKRR